MLLRAGEDVFRLSRLGVTEGGLNLRAKCWGGVVIAFPPPSILADFRLLR